MYRPLFIALVLSAILATTPVYSASPAPIPVSLSTLCDTIGRIGAIAANNRQNGWTLQASLDDLRPHLARSTAYVRDQSVLAIRLAHAVQDSPESIKQQVYYMCMAPEKAEAAQVRHAVPATPATKPVSQYTRWLNICTAAGRQAENIVAARDSGFPLTKALAIQERHIPTLGMFLNDMAVEIYTWTHWDKAQARREIETKCMAIAPR